MFKSDITSYTLLTPDFSIGGAALLLPLSGLIMFVLACVLWRMSRHHERVSRRRAEMSIVFLFALFPGVIFVPLILIPLLWDMRFPTYPHEKHDKMAVRRPWLARILYGETPQSLIAADEKSYESQVRMQKERPQLFRFIGSKKIVNRLRKPPQERAGRELRFLSLFVAFIGVTSVLMTAYVSYLSLVGAKSTEDVRISALEKNEGRYAYVENLAKNVQMGDGRVEWLAPQGRITSMLWRFGGIGLGHAVFNLKNPDTDLTYPPEGEWALARVYPEFFQGNSEKNEKGQITCTYVNGVLDPERIYVLGFPMLRVQNEPWAKPVLDLCPATFNPNTEPFASPVYGED